MEKINSFSPDWWMPLTGVCLMFVRGSQTEAKWPELTIVQPPLCQKDLELSAAIGDSSQTLTEDRCPRGNRRCIAPAGAKDKASRQDTVKCWSVILLAEVQILNRSYVGVECVLEGSPWESRWEMFFAEGKGEEKMHSCLLSLRCTVQRWTACLLTSPPRLHSCKNKTFRTCFLYVKPVICIFCTVKGRLFLRCMFPKGILASGFVIWIPSWKYSEWSRRTNKI